MYTSTKVHSYKYTCTYTKIILGNNVNDVRCGHVYHYYIRLLPKTNPCYSKSLSVYTGGAIILLV